MPTVTIYLKGWNDSSLYSDAVNDAGHDLHTEAMAVHLRSFQSYQAGDVMREAFTYVDDAPEPADDVVRERAFRWFNIGENVIARRYRDAGNRSLSVGDVVVIDGRAYAVGSFGWNLLDPFNPTISAR
jgi:hypothetical protein